MAEVELELEESILICRAHTIKFGGKYCRVCYLEDQVKTLRKKCGDLYRKLNESGNVIEYDR